MRYAGRWLQLTRRMPGVGRMTRYEKLNLDPDYACKAEIRANNSDSQAEVTETSGEEGEDRHSQSERPTLHGCDERKWGQLQQMSKHSLLQTLLQQIRHINDAAALIDEWVPEHKLRWGRETSQLGDEMGYSIQIITWLTHRRWLPQPIRRMRQLQHKVVSALSIGFVGFLDFDGDKTNPDNKADHDEFASFGGRRVRMSSLYHNQLLFLCSLHRLQQLPPQAVLCRLHGIFSRCCRFDLLLLVTLLTNTRQYVDGALWPGAHAEDIMTAFGAITNDGHGMSTEMAPGDWYESEMNS